MNIEKIMERCGSYIKREDFEDGDRQCVAFISAFLIVAYIVVSLVAAASCFLVHILVGLPHGLPQIMPKFLLINVIALPFYYLCFSLTLFVCYQLVDPLFGTSPKRRPITSCQRLIISLKYSFGWPWYGLKVLILYAYDKMREE